MHIFRDPKYVTHSKLQHFRLHAPYVYEDGTFEDLCEVILLHPQTDPEIIKRAGREISIYINFCMDIWTEVFSLDRNKYVHIPKENEKVDPLDMKIHTLWGSSDEESTYHLSDYVEDRELSNCLAMIREKEELFVFQKEEELKRYKYYGHGSYGYFLSKMLDGYKYFDAE